MVTVNPVHFHIGLCQDLRLDVAPFQSACSAAWLPWGKLLQPTQRPRLALRRVLDQLYHNQCAPPVSRLSLCKPERERLNGNEKRALSRLVRQGEATSSSPTSASNKSSALPPTIWQNTQLLYHQSLPRQLLSI